MEIGMKRQGSYYAIPVILNKQYDCDMLLDTGAGISVLQPFVAYDLGLEMTQAQSGQLSDGTEVAVPLTSGPVITVGCRQFQPNEVGIHPLPQHIPNVTALAGVLGADFFRELMILLDFPNEVLQIQYSDRSLQSTDRDKYTAPIILSPHGTLLLPVTLNESVTLECEIDTGSRRTVFPQRLMPELELSANSPNVRTRKVQHYDQEYDQFEATVDSIDLCEGIRIEKPIIRFQNTDFGFIGIDLLSSFRIWLNILDTTIAFL